MNFPSVFLKANWLNLAMINYEIDPQLLKSRVPSGTELDSHKGKYYVSLVGFWFCNTRVKGISIPFHQHFEEVNLRFYVRREEKNEIKRGVVFVKELVPKWAIAWLARQLYNENYVSLPMKHNWKTQNNRAKKIEYFWKNKSQWNFLKVCTQGESTFPAKNSHEEFITEHYWGYVSQKDGSTLEYQVEHPQWKVWQTQSHEFCCDVESIYGSEFVDILSQKPVSAFLAEGSEIRVRQGKILL